MLIGLVIWTACTAALLSALLFKSGRPTLRAARSIFTASILTLFIAAYWQATDAAERRYGHETDEPERGSMLAMTAEVDE